MSKLSSQIEAVLFFLGTEVSIKKLADTLDTPSADIVAALDELDQHNAERGLVLVRTDSTAMLATAADQADLIASLQKREDEAPLTKTALETLAIIMYKAPITRAEIDFIRGVNSTYAVRSLLLRGLVSRTGTGTSIVYEPTMDALQYLGISDRKQLPDYDQVLIQLQQAAEAGQTETTGDQQASDQPNPTA